MTAKEYYNQNIEQSNIPEEHYEQEIIQFMDEYAFIKTSETEAQLKQQDEIIGRLTRENEYLKDSQSRRNQWLYQAKKEAGYKDSVSFDDVWKETLEKANKLSQMRDKIVKELEVLKKACELKYIEMDAEEMPATKFGCGGLAQGYDSSISIVKEAMK
jgi:vacuolar-type H+-ATPase subunit I/STV1